MERILTYHIGKENAGWTILKFLKENHFSHSVIVQLKKTNKGILVNGEWAYVNQILQEHDQLTAQLLEPGENTGILAVDLPISVLYEDEDLLVVNKPAGMPVHPSMGHYNDTLANAVRFHAKQAGEAYPFRCINRLDRDTSGLAIVAKNAYSACLLYRQMAGRNIHRTYYAIVQGETPRSGTVNAPIARKGHTVIERTVDAVSGEPAITHYERLFRRDGLSFLRLTLETGRTHQIRVHMSYIGYPLIGDFLYNPGDTCMGRQALHAGGLVFMHPVTMEAMRFTAPLPEDMRGFFDVGVLDN